MKRPGLHELGRQGQQTAAAGRAAGISAFALHVHLEGQLAGLHDGRLLAGIARDLALRGLLVEQLYDAKIRRVSVCLRINLYSGPRP